MGVTEAIDRWERGLISRAELFESIARHVEPATLTALAALTPELREALRAQARDWLSAPGRPLPISSWCGPGDPPLATVGPGGDLARGARLLATALAR